MTSNNDDTVCAAGGGVWDANTSTCEDPDGGPAGLCLTCEAEIFGPGTSITKVVQSALSERIATSLVSFIPNNFYDHCRPCFPKLNYSGYEDLDVPIAVAELAEINGEVTCRDIDECIPDANGRRRVVIQP